MGKKYFFMKDSKRAYPEPFDVKSGGVVQSWGAIGFNRGGEGGGVAAGGGGGVVTGARPEGSTLGHQHLALTEEFFMTSFQLAQSKRGYHRRYETELIFFLPSCRALKISSAERTAVERGQ